MAPAQPSPAIQCDYLVIGAGTAGCLLANRLSENPKNRVALIEAGGFDDYIWIHIPVGYLYTQNNPRTDWCFKTEAEPGLNGRALNYPRGKVLGGCSSINGMIYMRGQARDYDQWRQLGNPGWGWDDVLPYFKRSENYTHGSDEFHSDEGEYRVEEPRIAWDILDSFRDAAAEVGIPKITDFNRGDNEGCAYFQVNQRSGVRWNTAKAFIRPIMGRKNLNLMTETLTDRLIIENGRVVGAYVIKNGRTKEVRANREVILSAGAIGSPQILERSGIGDPAIHQKIGVETQHELDGVGKNLQDHLQVRLVYKVENTVTLNEKAQSLINKAWMGVQYALFRRGPLTMAPSQLGAFAKSDPRFETANLQYHIQPLSLDKFGDPLHDFPAITASVCNLRPTSRGTSHAQNADPAGKPVIKPNYLSTDDDQQVAAESIRLTRQIMAAPALAPHNPSEYKPGPDYVDDADLVKAAGDLGTTIFHPAGTCKMGPSDDRSAVVGPDLKLHGLTGLRIADASVMPEIVSGNTNAPTLMIAEKTAAMVLADANY